MIQCVSGQPACVQTVFPTAEVCDGLDNDCNGLVDDMDTSLLRRAGRDPRRGPLLRGRPELPAAARRPLRHVRLRGRGPPHQRALQRARRQLQQPGRREPLPGVLHRPLLLARAGRQPAGHLQGRAAALQLGSWNACTVCTGAEVPGSVAYANCQILPKPETCDTPLDENCDGRVNESTGEGCGNCTPSATLPGCYTGRDQDRERGRVPGRHPDLLVLRQLGRVPGPGGPDPRGLLAGHLRHRVRHQPGNPLCAACNKDENCDGDVGRGVRLPARRPAILLLRPARHADRGHLQGRAQGL